MDKRPSFDTGGSRSSRLLNGLTFYVVRSYSSGFSIDLVTKIRGYGGTTRADPRLVNHIIVDLPSHLPLNACVPLPNCQPPADLRFPSILQAITFLCRRRTGQHDVFPGQFRVLRPQWIDACVKERRVLGEQDNWGGWEVMSVHNVSVGNPQADQRRTADNGDPRLINCPPLTRAMLDRSQSCSTDQRTLTPQSIAPFPLDFESSSSPDSPLPMTVSPIPDEPNLSMDTTQKGKGSHSSAGFKPSSSGNDSASEEDVPLRVRKKPKTMRESESPIVQTPPLLPMVSHVDEQSAMQQRVKAGRNDLDVAILDTDQSMVVELSELPPRNGDPQSVEISNDTQATDPPTPLVSETPTVHSTHEEQSPPFVNALGLSMTFHVLAATAQRKQNLELQITSSGAGGVITPLKLAQIIIIPVKRGSLDQHSKLQPFVDMLRPYQGRPDKVLVYQDWIDEWFTEGVLGELVAFRAPWEILNPIQRAGNTLSIFTGNLPDTPEASPTDRVCRFDTNPLPSPAPK